jgi:hypothetical protein
MQGYKDGWTSGEFMAVWAFNSYGGQCTPTTIPAFQTALLTIIGSTRPPNTDPYGLCRISGYFDGVAQRLSDLLSKTTGCCGGTVVNQCCTNGNDIGVIYADGYCLIAIATGGGVNPGQYFRPPVPPCGMQFEVCCDATFKTTAYNNAACTQYTADPHAETFYNMMMKECAYKPQP